MIAVWIFAGVFAAGSLLGLLAAVLAPVGYQDETGFHFGRQRGATEIEVKPLPYRHPVPKAA